MTLGFIGLGRMGFNMVHRLVKHKHKVVAYNRSPDKTRLIAKKGALPSYSLDELLSKLPKRKVIWLMLPAGKPTDDMIRALLPKLKKGDILIDGANDFFKNAERHDRWCKKRGIYFFDIGVSGGVWGLKNGYTLMVGGPKKQFKDIEKYCKALAPKNGYGHFGKAGTGHFVKSIHNVVEYSYLQGLGEGIELLTKFKQPIDIKKATEVWGPASVVRSWLLDLTHDAVSKPSFKKIKPHIGSVTMQELRDTVKAVNGYAPGFQAAVKVRKDKSNKFKVGKRTIAAVRSEFGGHAVKK